MCVESGVVVGTKAMAECGCADTAKIGEELGWWQALPSCKSCSKVRRAQGDAPDAADHKFGITLVPAACILRLNAPNQIGQRTY